MKTEGSFFRAKNVKWYFEWRKSGESAAFFGPFDSFVDAKDFMESQAGFSGRYGIDHSRKRQVPSSCFHVRSAPEKDC